MRAQSQLESRQFDTSSPDHYLEKVDLNFKQPNLKSLANVGDSINIKNTAHKKQEDLEECKSSLL